MTDAKTSENSAQAEQILFDQTITCKDCRSQFMWTVGEQRFYKEKGFMPPARCKSCRDKRKMKGTAV